MIEHDDLKELQERFDGRYKLRDDCERDMDVVNKSIHKHDVDDALIFQQLSIIKWVTTSTLGAALAALIGLIVSKLTGG